MKKTFAAVLLISAVAPASALAGLVNGGFESPSNTPGISDNFYPTDGSFPGWHTTATDHTFEIWTDGFLGVVPYEGAQFAELNANQVSTLYQDATGVAAGSLVGFQFAHRGRLGVDTLSLTITDLGADNVPGGGDDTTLFSQNYSDGNTAWGFYTNPAPITALGNTMRFAYDSVSSTGGLTIGNFLDAADFGVGVGVSVGNTVPEPLTLSMFLGGLAPLRWALGRRKTARSA